MKIGWAHAAESDLDNIVRWIARDNVTAAFDMEDRIRRAVAGLASMPRRARVGRAPGTRELVIGGSPYVAIFAVDGDDVTITNIVHGAQNWPP